MRPIYEDEYTLKKEKDILDVACKEWGLIASPKLPMKNHMDYILMKDECAVCFVEIKFRTKIYDTYYISLHKFMSALQYQSICNMPSFLVVEFPTGIKFLRFNSKLIHHIGMANLFSRNDKDDNELVAHIEMRHFEPIGGRNPFR